MAKSNHTDGRDEHDHPSATSHIGIREEPCDEELLHQHDQDHALGVDSAESDDYLPDDVDGDEHPADDQRISTETLNEPERVRLREIYLHLLEERLLLEGLGESALLMLSAMEAYRHSEFGGVPASADSIAALEKQKFGGVDGDGAANAGCVVCIQDYEVGDELGVMPCSYRHRFHQMCIVEWLSRSRLCPLCRHALPAEVWEQTEGLLC